MYDMIANNVNELSFSGSKPGFWRSYSGTKTFLLNVQLTGMDLPKAGNKTSPTTTESFFLYYVKIHVDNFLSKRISPTSNDSFKFHAGII